MADPNPRPRFDVHNPHSRAGQAFVKYARKVYHPIGFKKGYNFPLFIIGVGGLLGFCLSRVQYMDFNFLKSQVMPGEMFWYGAGFRRIGIQMHVIGAVMGGMLASLQFIPIIRYKAILFHRLNGYAASLLFFIGNAGAFMILRHVAGGTIAAQTWGGVFGVYTTSALVLALVNIKRLQIDQHRAWMIRMWTVAACIATERLLLLASEHVVTRYKYDYWQSIPCREIFFMYKFYGVPDQANPTAQIYPMCGANGLDAATNRFQVAVSVHGEGPENVAALLRMFFGPTGWIAMIIHMFCAELYLWLTPAESYRLRTVSYQRQVEAGMRQPGHFDDSGTTAKTMGDAPDWWSIPMDEYQRQHLLNVKIADDSASGDEPNQTLALDTTNLPHISNGEGGVEAETKN